MKRQYNQGGKDSRDGGTNIEEEDDRGPGIESESTRSDVEGGGSTVHLQWGSSPSWSSGSWSSLYRDKRLADISLLSQEMVSFRVHKVVLGASSRLLERLVVEHPTPLLFLRSAAHCTIKTPHFPPRGVSTSMLEVLIQFVYLGEVEVPQDMVEELLETAQDLGIQGLDGGEPVFSQNIGGTIYRETKSEETQLGQTPLNHNIKQTVEIGYPDYHNIIRETNIVDRGNQDFRRTMANINANSKVQYKCKECQESFESQIGLENHKMSRHYQNFFKCDICGKEFSQRGNLKSHVQKNHRHNIGNKGAKFSLDIMLSKKPIVDPIKVEEQNQMDETMLKHMFGDMGQYNSPRKNTNQKDTVIQEVLLNSLVDVKVKEDVVVNDALFDALNQKKPKSLMIDDGTTNNGAFMTNPLKPKHQDGNKHEINSLSFPPLDRKLVQQEIKSNKQIARVESPDNDSILPQKIKTDQIRLHQTTKCLKCPKQFVTLVQSDNGGPVKGTRFTQAEIDQHMRTHLRPIPTILGPAGPFFCDKCDKTFEYGTLESHKRSLHPTTSRIEELKCNFCKRRYAQENNLNTHMKSMHFDDWAKWKVNQIALSL